MDDSGIKWNQINLVNAWDLIVEDSCIHLFIHKQNTATLSYGKDAYESAKWMIQWLTHNKNIVTY